MAKEKHESEAMKLLEEEQKQKTTMNCLNNISNSNTEKESKKTKKEKDPLKPNHPMSAYFLFTNDRSAALLAENKNVPKCIWQRRTRKNICMRWRLISRKKDEEVASVKKEKEEHMKLHKLDALQLLKK